MIWVESSLSVDVARNLGGGDESYVMKLSNSNTLIAVVIWVLQCIYFFYEALKVGWSWWFLLKSKNQDVKSVWFER